MPKYALMKNPAHTKVSFQDTNALAIKELALFAPSATHIESTPIGGVPYITFEAESLDATTISRLSFVYAIFQITGETLTPIHLAPNHFIDPELSSILKYQGKTNELFTRLMLNIAHKYSAQEKLNILDPMAGKGTTLYEALIHGHNAYGIEMDPKPVHEAVVYLKKYLETAKYKHTSHTEKISGMGTDGKFTSTRNTLAIGRNKEDDKRIFEILDGDARNAHFIFRKNYFDAIVADLPYGVQHGSKTAKKPTGKTITRNALGLVTEAMPGWIKVLKPGGVVVLAWNLFLITQEEMAQVFAKHGLKVQELNFDHKVDQAIDRGLIVGIL